MRELGLGELLAALSMATDLANGMPLEKSMRTCQLAVSVGRELGLDDVELSHTFYVTLLRSIGCTAFASEEAAAYGDDVVYRNPSDSRMRNASLSQIVVHFQPKCVVTHVGVP